MVEYTIVFVGLAALLAAILKLWNPSRACRTVDEFPEIVRAMVIRLENGSFCRLDHCGSSLWFSFERQSGDGEEAQVALRLPKNTWTAGHEDKIEEVYKNHGFEFSRENDSYSLLGIVKIRIADIYDPVSAARSAHAARLFLQTIGVDQFAKFRVSEEGMPSKRALANADKIKEL